MITIAQKVKEFLHNNPQPRKSVVRFIIVDCNKKMSAKEFDKVYANQYRGHYGVNFLQWERLGNIKRNKGIYSLSDGFYEQNRGLYSCYSIDREKKANKAKSKECNNCKKLQREIIELKEQLKQTESQRQHSNLEVRRLTIQYIKLERKNNALELDSKIMSPQFLAMKSEDSELIALAKRTNQLLEQIRDNK